MAKITIEVEVEVTGTYTPGYPASRDDPGSDGEVNDLAIEGLTMEVTTGWDRALGRYRTERIDLLATAGKSHDNPASEIVGAILDAIRDEAESAATMPSLLHAVGGV